MTSLTVCSQPTLGLGTSAGVAGVQVVTVVSVYALGLMLGGSTATEADRRRGASYSTHRCCLLVGVEAPMPYSAIYIRRWCFSRLFLPSPNVAQASVL